jgi:hypothetical protein
VRTKKMFIREVEAMDGEEHVVYNKAARLC